MSLYENIHGFVKEDIAHLIISNRKWHKENNIGPSLVFTPEFINQFTSHVVIEFKNWINQYVSS